MEHFACWNSSFEFQKHFYLDLIVPSNLSYWRYLVDSWQVSMDSECQVYDSCRYFLTVAIYFAIFHFQRHCCLSSTQSCNVHLIVEWWSRQAFGPRAATDLEIWYCCQIFGREVVMADSCCFTASCYFSGFVGSGSLGPASWYSYQFGSSEPQSETGSFVAKVTQMEQTRFALDIAKVRICPLPFCLQRCRCCWWRASRP